MEIAKGSLCFLDLKISIVDYKLATNVYSKPTDSHLYLQSNSCHNPKAIDGIQKGIALKIRRIYGIPSSKRSLTKESKTSI